MFIALSVLLGLALVGFLYYLWEFGKWEEKIELFSNYQKALVKFHENIVKDKGIDFESKTYLLKNALRISLDSPIKIGEYNPVLNMTTEFVGKINDIVTLNCHDFTETCELFSNVLIQNAGYFEERTQKIQSEIKNPFFLYFLVRKGLFFFLNEIPIVNLIPIGFKDFLTKIFAMIVIINTISSVWLKKEFIYQSIIKLFESIIKPILTWISTL